MKSIIAVLFLIALCSCTQEKPKTLTLAMNNDSGYTQQSELQKSIARGKEVYSDFCITCHMANGTGTAGVFPPLAGSDWLKAKPAEDAIKAVKYGLNGAIKVNGKTYNSAMMPMGLSDEEVADVLNYVMNNWGNTQKKMITEEQVSKIKKE